MKREYDFTNAEQGRFFTKPEDIIVPYHLKPPLEARLRKAAAVEGKTPWELLESILANELTRREQARSQP
jgi:hypothetical protein